jgi:hypothetical protein
LGLPVISQAVNLVSRASRVSLELVLKADQTRLSHNNLGDQRKAGDPINDHATKADQKVEVQKVEVRVPVEDKAAPAEDSSAVAVVDEVPVVQACAICLQQNRASKSPRAM